MKNFNQPTIVFTFLCLVLILNSWLISSLEIQEQKEFDYRKDSGKGPEKWGDLHKEWEECKKGKMQSPINFVDKMVKFSPELGKINKSYKPTNATLKNRGHDISVQFVIGSAGSIQINGSEYELDRLHWHSPSEHAINGKRFAVEIHMVHQNRENNKFAVIGVLYRIGSPDSFISELEERITDIADSNTFNKKENIGDSNKEVSIGMVNPRHLKIGGRKYYRYSGSLTTPPCTEGVLWTVHKRGNNSMEIQEFHGKSFHGIYSVEIRVLSFIRTVSRKQVRLLRYAVHDDAKKNARPIQQVNNRQILFYNGKNYHH